MKKNVNKMFLIVSAFGDPNDSNSRIYNICREISTPIVITTNFDHSRKTYRDTAYKEKNLICISVPSYKKNISLKRLYSHFIFAVKLNFFLNNMEGTPRAIYCTMPTSLSAYFCGQYCRKKGVKFIVDVIDLWPDSLIPISFFFKILSPFLYFWRQITILAYKKADYILGESEKYVKIAHYYNHKVPFKYLYLGVDQKLVQELINQSKLRFTKSKNEVWICYGGSLGMSYDFDEILMALKKINDLFDYKFFFVGDGVNRISIQKLIDKYQLKAHITGFLSYSDYLAYLSYCDIAINIFKENTKVVHSYKFNDYVATNCFILNSLKGETADLINKYKVGLNFDFTEYTLSSILCNVLSNWDFYKTYKVNNDCLIKEVLDKRNIYSQLKTFIDDQV